MDTTQLTRRQWHGLVLGGAMSGVSAGAQSRDWRMLFDGSSTDAWRGYRSSAMPVGWRVENGVLGKDGVTGDIITRDQFADFELEMDWRLGEAGNSGIFYRGTEEYDHVYWSAPEYQLLDDTA